MTDTPPPRRPRTLRRVLLIVAVVLVVCCGGAAAAGFGIYKWYNGAAGPAQDVTNEYLGDLETGQPAAAYALTCPDFRSNISEASFVATQKQRPQPRSHKIVGTSVETVNGQRNALITVTVARADGSNPRVVIPLLESSGHWYVCAGNPLP